ncbi:hypothetical protein IIC38_11850 [candidate division KSB1 bacterium]|nr:hypothetical protein [candidate division KSB1 bacterium]
MTWKDAYLKQAFSDYSIYQEFQKPKNRKPVCHQLHYLQMATEKFSKSQLCKGNKPPEKKTHFVLVRYLRTIKRLPQIRNMLGFKGKHEAFGYFIDSLIPVADMIENLAPAGSGMPKPNPEYPWEDVKTKQVVSPLDYEFMNLSDSITVMAKFKALFDTLMHRHGYKNLY